MSRAVLRAGKKFLDCQEAKGRARDQHLAVGTGFWRDQAHRFTSPPRAVLYRCVGAVMLDHGCVCELRGIGDAFPNYDHRRGGGSVVRLVARERGTAETAIVARLSRSADSTHKSGQAPPPEPVCEFELRVGDLRVLSDVVDEEVIVLIIGRKVGNTLVVNGEEFHEHQADPPQSSGGGPSGNAD